MQTLTDTPAAKPVFGNGERANKLKATKFGGRLVSEYWEHVFRAKEEGKKVVWYNGTYIPPFFHSHDLVWVHGEAWAAMLAARHKEIGAQARGDERGYDRELCSYARTHIGQMLIEKDKLENGTSTLDPTDPRIETMLKLPAPDMIVNAYPYCSSGQQWDDITYRMFGKKIPMFTVQIPMLWGGRKDAGYMQGEEWQERSRYVAEQLVALTRFLEENTGRKFDFDRLSETMGYVKKAAELRLEAMDLCTATPSPASFFDWIVSIAPVNFLPGDQNLVDYFEGVKAEIVQRIADGEGAVKDEKYRLFFDGMMNWNKVGWLADKFASVNACVVAGRYTHMSFWQEPQLIDLKDPVLGMAQNYLICPNNHGAPIMIGEIENLCDKFHIDGVVCHASRTCRGMTNSQFLIAGSAKKYGRQAMFFEGDVADESFYKDELLNTRLEAMVEAMDARKRAA
ncbi:2-hydroxyacyl-CoA dehydratase subunit D [Salipiger sp.]|uniref:2-hydroxyacyl-CoA dehydratase subunit D n=1 Tax=Salipiger sp. TaxID=2078585 RepID=UPI003A981712